MALPAIVSSAGRFLATQTAKKVLSGSSDKNDSKNSKDTKGVKESGAAKYVAKPQENKVNSSSFFGSSEVNPNIKSSSAGYGDKGEENCCSKVQEKVVKIEKLLKDSFVFKKKQEEKNRKQSESKTRLKKEETLEGKTKEEKDNKFSIPVPGKGLFSQIMSRAFNFIFWITLGKIIPDLIKFKPLLIGIVKVLSTIVNGAIDIFGFILDGFISFIDFGFKVWDTVRGIAKFIGGENLVGILDGLTGAITTMMNLAIIAAMLTMGDDGLDFGKDKKKNRERGRSKRKPGTRGRPKVTTSGGKSAGPLGGIRDKLTRPFRESPKVTTSGGKSAGPLGGIRDKLTRPFQSKRKITGDVPNKNIFSGLSERFKGASEGAGKLFKGASEGAGKLFKGASELYKNTIGKLSEKIDGLLKQGPKKLMEWMSNQKGIIGELGKKLPGFFDSSLIKKLGKALPFVGDVVGFVFDIIGGIDWRRALIRAVVGATIDAGFNTLAAALVAATPFTGGASTAVAIALYSAYMAADVVSGGFGKILGDKIADFLKLPMNAGGDGGPSPKTAGTESDLKNVKNDIAKKRAEDKEFNDKISLFENKDKQPTKKPEETEKKFTGGIIHGFKSGGTIAPPKKQASSKIYPGKDIGGKEKILKLFPDSKEENKGVGGIFGVLSTIFGKEKNKKIDLPNALSSLKKTIEILRKIPFVGELMAAGIQIAIGQRPDKSVFDMLYGNMKFLISKIVSLNSADDISSISKEILKLSSGGITETSELTQSDIIDSDKLTKSFSSAISFAADNKINLALLEIQKEIEKSDKSKDKYDKMKKEEEEERKRQEEERLRQEQLDQSSPDSSPDTPDSSGGGAGGGIYKPILDLIAKYEAGSGKWESMYPSTKLPGATKMTIAEVARKATGAVGMYQNLPEHLVARAKAIGLDPNKDLYNEENQRKIAVYLIERGQAGVTPKMLKDNPDEAMIRMSKVWAAIPVPKDMQGHRKRVKRGESYYAGVGSNKAHITPEMMYQAMGASVKLNEKPKDQEKYVGSDPRSKDKEKSGPKISGGSIVNIGKSLISQGFAVAEHPDFTKTTPKGSYTPGKGSVSNVHKGKGHYEGRAIDVTDWRGSLEDSKKRYREVLSSLQGNPSINMLIHDSWGAMYGAGTAKQPPGSHGHPTHMHIETKSRFHGGPIEKDSMVKIHGGEFVIDKDSVDIFGMDFLKSINLVENLSAVKNVAPYLIERISEVVRGKKAPKSDKYVKEEDPKKKEAGISASKTKKFFEVFNRTEEKKQSVNSTLSELREMRSRSLERQGRESEAQMLRSYGINNINLFNENNKINYNFNEEKDKKKDGEIDYGKLMQNSFSKESFFKSVPSLNFNNYNNSNIPIPTKDDSINEFNIPKENPNLYKLDYRNIQKFKSGGLVDGVSKYPSYGRTATKTKLVFVPTPVSTPQMSPAISKSTGYMPAEMISLNSMDSRMKPIHDTSRS